jgi:hypothetical protein
MIPMLWSIHTYYCLANKEPFAGLFSKLPCRFIADLFFLENVKQFVVTIYAGSKCHRRLTVLPFTIPLLQHM